MQLENFRITANFYVEARHDRQGLYFLAYFGKITVFVRTQADLVRLIMAPKGSRMYYRLGAWLDRVDAVSTLPRGKAA